MKSFPARLAPPPSCSCFLAVGLLVSLAATAADWAEWRGSQREDRSPDQGLLKDWPAGGPKRVWLNENTGLGYSGVAVVGGQVLTMGLRGEQEFLLGLDAATGKETWATPIGAKYENNWGDGPRGTPTVDGGHVFALGGQGTLICAQATDGKVLWQKSLTADLGGKMQGWGFTESPLLVGNLVLCTPGGSQGTMAALDRKSGNVVWRTKDLTDQTQYSSPILVQHAGKPHVIQLVMKKYFGVDPADGRVVWTQDFDAGRVAVIPTPIYFDNQVYITAGYGAGCSSVTLDASGKATLAYENKVMKNHHGGVIRVGDHLYGHSDGYGWVCQELKTGKEVWVHKDFPKGAIAYADGRFYCLAEGSGEVALVEASPKGWTDHGRFKLDPQTKQRKPEGRIWTHPVVINGRLYLRDQELLSSYDVKG